MIERDLQPLRDQVLGEAERHAVVGRRDPEHVRPLGRVDEALAALVGDCERDVRVARDLPGGVDAGALVDDRDRAVGDRLADVADGGARGQARVVALDAEAVLDRRSPSTLAFEAASSAPSAIVWPTYGVLEKGALTAIVTRLGLGRVRALVAAAAGEDGAKRDDEKESPHESFCRPR